MFGRRNSTLRNRSYRPTLEALEALNLPGGLLGAPTPLGPTDTIDHTQPVFEWEAVEGAESYFIRVSIDVDQGKPVPFFMWRDALVERAPGMDMAPTSFEYFHLAHPDFLTPGSTYTWWVHAIDAQGVGGHWSLGSTFSITS